MGCHGNHAFHIVHTRIFEDNFVSHSRGPNEQFGTHEKLSWGAGYGKSDAGVLGFALFEICSI